MDAHDNAHVIDWFAASQGHDGYLTEDGINLTEDGIAAYTKTVKEAMGR